MIKIVTIIGSRPEGIKMAPVIKMLHNDKRFESIVCVTAQHREMLDQVLDIFNITPDVDLNLMRPKQSPLQVLSAICDKLPKYLERYKPDWVLVQGDTTTVLASSLVAFHLKIKVGHVEAGLRSKNKNEPFPEEMNRTVAGVIADLHFAPTENAKRNLIAEGIQQNIVVSGNPVIDAQKLVLEMPITTTGQQILGDLGSNGKHNNEARVILVTAHRRENFGFPLLEICDALKEIAEYYGNRVRIVYPVHMNPNVREVVNNSLCGVSNIYLTEPMDYVALTHLMKKSYLVLTDSGGIQEEAPSLGVPVLVMRNVTERMEGVEVGTAKLVGTSRERIVTEVKKLMDNQMAYEDMSKAQNPYGDGRAAENILNALSSYQN